jgi:hypothetical protein
VYLAYFLLSLDVQIRTVLYYCYIIAIMIFLSYSLVSLFQGKK